MTRRPRVHALAVALVLSGASVASCSSAPPDAAPPATTAKPHATFSDPADALRQAEVLARQERCQDVQVAYLAVQSVPLALASGTSPGETIDRFRQDVEDLRAKIPDQIKADYDVLADAYEAFVAELDGLDLGELSKARDNADRIRDATRALDAPAVGAAKQRIEGYFEACSAQGR